MNWSPVLELLPQLIAVVMLLAIVELRRRIERAYRALREVRTEVEAQRTELESLRPPKGEA